MSIKNYDCAVIGDWHLAFVTAGVLSHVGLKVLLVNHNGDKQIWTQFPEIPVAEPGLKEMFDKSIANGQLDYSNAISKDWQAKYVWMAVDTPVDANDNADTEPLLKIVAQIKATQPQLKAFILSSQIPIGFCASIQEKYNLPVAYIPENLRLGKGIETFYKADRTVIGASTQMLADEIKTLLSPFQTEFLVCNLQTSEMVKHANNAFLATSISFANELARLGESFQVDNLTVAKALKLDKRIGPAAYVVPGLGFAGGTLPRDIRVLQKTGKVKSIPMRMMNAVMDVNEDTTSAIVETIEAFLKPKITKNILILGYTYKADTNTLRRSLSLDIGEVLTQKGYQVYGYDPVMNDRDLSLLKNKIQHIDDIQRFDIKPDLIAIMTARPIFKTLNWQGLAALWQMAKNDILVFDTQNFLDAKDLLPKGFMFKKLWGAVEKHD
jgi:UDPglucose 6-dehydrogenase